MRHIKRYSNRKLYDTEIGRYTTLERIAEQVRAGDEIQVVMHATGADITAQTLAQVLYVEIADGRSNISVATLREIICHGLAPDGDFSAKTSE